MFNGKALLIFLCIFLAGGVAGGFVGVRIGCNKTSGKKKDQSAQVQNQPRRPVEEWSKRFQKDFVTKVGITPEQQAQLDPLIQAAQVEFRSLRERFGQKAADVSERLDGQVLALLTPEQKPKYEQIIKERQERLKKKMEDERAARGEKPRKPDAPPPPPSGEKLPPPPSSDVIPPPPPPSAGVPGEAPVPKAP